MGNQIEFAPLLPMPLLWALIVLIALYVGLCIWRRLSGWPYRALACVAVLAALFGPVLKEEVRDPLRTVLALVPLVTVLLPIEAGGAVDPEAGDGGLNAVFE